jgi:hypothetical protein
MPKINASVSFTARDYALLYYIWQNRLMTTRHFIAKFWPGVSKQAAALRLKRLREAKLINHVELPWLKERVLYTASKAGNQALCGAGLLDAKFIDDYPRRPQDFTESMKHDLQVVDVRIAFEGSGAVDDWVSDHEMRLARRSDGLSSRTPDGVFALETNAGALEVVLELERIAYRKTKFVAILSRLRAHYPAATVMFVTRSKERIRNMQAWAKAGGSWDDRPDGLLFATYEDALEDGLDAPWEDMEARLAVWRPKNASSGAPV